MAGDGDRAPGRRLGIGLRPSTRAGLIGFASTCGLMLLCSAVFTVGYMEKDDVIIADLASGVDTGQPSFRLVFVGAVPGAVVSALHRVAPSIGWYAITLLATLALVQTAMGLVVWRLRRRLGPARVAAAGAAWLSATAVFTVSLSFSPIAITTAVGSVVLLLAALLVDGRRRTALLGCAVLVGFAAFQWRREALLGVLLLFAPTLLVALYRLRRASIGVVLASVVAVALSLGLDAAPVRSDAWRDYREFNNTRHQMSNTTLFASIRDRVDEPDVRRALADAGWTSDQVTLMAYWFFYDREVFSGKQMESLLSVVKSHGRPAPLGEAANVRWRIGLIVFTAAALSLFRVRRRRWWYLALQPTWIVGVCTLVRLTKRFPPHVSLPVTMGSVLVLTIAPRALGFERAGREPDVGRSTALSRRDRFAFAATMSFALSFGFVVLVTLSHRNAEARSRLRADIAALNAVDPGGRFVNAGVAVEVEGSSPFRVKQKQPMRVMTAWHSTSPHDDAFRARVGLEGDLLEQLVNDDDAYLVIWPKAADAVVRTYAAERGMTVELRAVGELQGGESVIYRVERVG